MGENRLKKMIIGEKMPDKNDPKYQRQYEKDVEAGRRFARILKLDVLTGYIQIFAEKHRRLFLAIVFSIVFSPRLRKRSEQMSQTFNENLTQRENMNE